MSVGHYGDRQCTTKKECSTNEAYVKRQDHLYDRHKRKIFSQKGYTHSQSTSLPIGNQIRFDCWGEVLCDRILTCRHTLSGKSLYEHT